MKQTFLIIFALSFILTSCSNPKSDKKAESTISLEQIWEIDGFSMPESVLSVADHEYIYVSNVNHSNSGSISRISKDGKDVNHKWVMGVDSPTGMGYYKNHIYVADQTKVHKINIKSSKIVETYESDAKGLNDLVISADGQVYIGDLVGGAIYALNNEKLELWLKPDKIKHPNGLNVKDGVLYVGNLGAGLLRSYRPDQYGTAYEIDIQTKVTKEIETTHQIGTIDGLEIHKGDLLISSPFTNKLYQVTNNKKKEILTIEGTIADIGLDEENGILYTPLLYGNKVVAFKIK